MPPGVTIVSLGPGDSRYWTLAAYEVLHQAGEVYLRTARHPSIADIPVPTHNFDDRYEQAADLDRVLDQIAAEIVRLGQRAQGVVYAVPGDSGICESTTPRIRALAADKDLPLVIIPGVSFLEPTLAALNTIDALNNLQLVDAPEVARLHHPPLAPDRPALVAHLYGQKLVTRLKQVLLNAYPGNLEVTLVWGAGTAAERLGTCPLARLDYSNHLDQMATLYLPPSPTYSSLASFQETVAHLRAPEGCPWDRKQTHQSLRPHLLEETYEVLETLDSGDLPALAEELGDLLLQIALHVQIATESGEFKMGDVVGQINQKLLRRHPHVFGNTKVNGVEEVLANWEAIKRTEKARSNRVEVQGSINPSALDGVPKDLPALAQAMAISKKAVRVGFEWPDIEGVLDKLIEEAREITEATDPVHVEAEIGDLLFSAVNLARWRNIDPESALRSTNARFVRRFQKLEALAAAAGKNLPGMSIGEMDALWEQAKRLVE